MIGNGRARPGADQADPSLSIAPGCLDDRRSLPIVPAPLPPNPNLQGLRRPQHPPQRRCRQAA